MKALAALLLFTLVSGQLRTVANASTTGTQTVIPHPKIVIYTAPWCSSCNAASEYFYRNRIPFVKKDIDYDDRYLEEMTAKYKSRAVPLIVIGKDQKVLRGFVPEMFQRALKEVLLTGSR